MEIVYGLYLIAAITSIILYKENSISGKIGFSISALASLVGMYFFFTHLTDINTMKISGNFLFNPHFRLTPVGNFFSFVISSIAFATSLYSIQYVDEYKNKISIGTLSFFFNIFILSMLLVISSANVFWFMIFWELMTLVSYFLIMFNNTKESLKATVIYMGIAHIGGSLILAAFLLLAHASGSMEFISFSNAKLSPTLASVIFLLAFAGFGSKAGMFPFHVWLPKAHPAAPSNISALMSGVMIKVAIFGIIQFCLWLPLQTWWGILILIIGALSALLGVLYALMQHDYKALLAYHSVENIGIILLGIGTGVYGLATHSLILASVGFLAGMYHVLNHATFKGLLFLGAGSVLYTTHTKDMEILGGLARKMPYTAFAFLIGSMAITALPPLNGFVSEWFTYQSMLQAALGDGFLYRLIFILSIVALALTGALAVMCFVKVYSVIFGGVPRDKKIFEKAKEVPFFMLAGMYVLVIGCFAYGLGASKVTQNILNVVGAFSTKFDAIQGGIVVSPLGSMISTPLIAVILIAFMALPFVLVVIFKNNQNIKIFTRETTPWACGFKYSPRMQMTADPFTGALKTALKWLYRQETKVEDQGYFKPVKYHSHVTDIWWKYLYEPFIAITEKTADKIVLLQNGKANQYVLYVLIALFVFIGLGLII